MDMLRLTQRLVATWAEFQHSLMYNTIDQHRKDWKNAPMQKMVTKNTYCDIACLTFQLPHTTTGSFQSHQRLKEHSKPSVRCKSLAFHKLMWRHFQAGWTSGLQFVLFWRYNVNNQNYVYE